MLFKYDEHRQLVDKDVNPLDYENVDDFRRDLSAVSFLSKADFLNVNVDRRAVALEKFFKAEAQCLETNERLLEARRTGQYPDRFGSLLLVMTRQISELLGDCRMSDVLDYCGWGPGATFHLRGNDTSGSNKFLRERGITHDLYPLHAEILSYAWPTWAFHNSDPELWFTRVAGGHLTTVPKNAKTDRVIAIEPGINTWYQKGVGHVLRSRLKRWGINLNDQSRNQRLACEGSKHSYLATVDFSAASDTISLELVRELLPPRWFALLDACRSKSVHVQDSNCSKPIYLSKFSSMGNGFTFELETLIFCAAAKSVCQELGITDSDVSVYGDDVIIPFAAIPLFREFCGYIGFSLNTEKTHSLGYYRESCGAHFFKGVDVKPIFLKERVTNVEAVYKLANNIRRLAHRYNSHCGCDGRFLDVWKLAFDSVPNKFRFLISEGFGDGGFISNFDESRPVLIRNNPRTFGWEGFSCRTAQRVGITYSSNHVGLLLDRLRLMPFNASPAENSVNNGGSLILHGNSIPFRNRSRVRIGELIVPKWYNLGAWI
jgi:hypothetical protein